MAAASVIHVGEELVGLYFESWPVNAQALEESRPDTLWVEPEDSVNLAFVLNNFLGPQDKIQMVDTILALHNLRSLPRNEFQEGVQALQNKVNELSDFHEISMLADLEPGVVDVKYT